MAPIGDLIAGGAMGLPFTMLYDAVKFAVAANSAYKSLLKSLQSTMKTIGDVYPSLLVETPQPPNEPLKDDDNDNDEDEDEDEDDDDLPKANGEEVIRLKKLMEDGTILVKRCSKVKKWNILKMYSMSGDLKELEDEIKRYFDLELPLRTGKDFKDFIRLFKKHLGGNRTVRVKRWLEAPSAPEFVVGLDGPFGELKKKLLEKGVSGHVISAPGGHGKTTLAKRLVHDAEIKEKFKGNIFFLCVSKDPDFTVMVQKMFKNRGEEVPDMRTLDDAINQLQGLLTRIGKQPILLVLDDVWSEPLLEKFVLKSLPYYKILVTSRSLFQTFGPPCQLKGLDVSDALKLFLYSATPSNGMLEARNGDLRNKLAGEIVELCKGSPLALTVVGRSLCGKDLKEWENRRDGLSQGSLLYAGLEKEILNCLEKSIVDLEKETCLKDCFLDFGCFPEDHKIPASVLIDMWAQFPGLDNEVHAIANLQKLCARSLVDLLAVRENISFTDGFYGDLKVMQHDLLRQLAIHHNSQGPIEQRKRLNLQIQRNKFPEWFKEQNKPENARLLSICTDDKFSSCWPDMELPAVEVLVLNIRTKDYTLPSFIEKMDNLRTLIVANNGFSPAEISNFSVVGSLPKLKRIRLERIKVPLLSMPAGACFPDLEKVSLFMCNMNISETIMASDAQFSDAFPKLMEIDISYCSDLQKLPPGICGLETLKKISITNCHNLSELPSELGKNLEVLRLNSCTELKGLPESIDKLKELGFLDISNCFHIDALPEQIGELQNLVELHVKGLELSRLPRSMRKLHQLKYVFCDDERAALWRPLLNDLGKLKVIVDEEEKNLNWLM